MRESEVQRMHAEADERAAAAARDAEQLRAQEETHRRFIAEQAAITAANDFDFGEVRDPADSESDAVRPPQKILCPTPPTKNTGISSFFSPAVLS